MTLSPEKEKLCDDLVAVMERLCDLLEASGEDPLEYRGIEKVKNIARSGDPRGVKKIARHLDGDIRVIYDNRVSSNEIEQQFEQAYSIADRL